MKTDPLIRVGVAGYYLDHVTDELLHTTQYHRDANMTASEVDYPDGGN